MALSDDERSVDLDEDFSVLPDQTTDDTDRGWGEAPVRRPKKSEFSAHDLDLMAERPPHWS